MSERNDDRRKFLAAAAAGAGFVAIAPGIRLVEIAAAKPDSEPVTAKVRWGMLIDTTRCQSGCTECISACNKENHLGETTRPRTDAQWIRKIDLKELKTGRALSLPMMCQHCAEPPCVDVCPTGASFKRADGIVLVDKHICIGCRYCMMACPYNARSFIHEPLEDQRPHAPRGKGTVESCTLCVHRVDEGRVPACVEACNDSAGGAMLFGDLNDPASEISRRVATYRTTRIRSDLGTDPGVHYRNI